MKVLWDRISEIGVTDDLSFSDRKRVVVLNRVSVIVSLVTLLYLIYDLVLLSPDVRSKQMVFWLLHLTAILIFIPVLVFNHLTYYNSSRLIMFIALFAVLSVNSYVHAVPYRTDAYFFILSIFCFIIFSNYWLLILSSTVTAFTYYLISAHIISRIPDLQPLAIGLEARIAIQFFILFVINYLLNKENEEHQHKLEEVNSQLMQSHENLAKSNFTKDKIFSIISHDLRSPLNTLQGMLSLFKVGTLSEKDAKSYAEQLEKQVIQLNSSLEELLMWSSGNIQGIKVMPETVVLRPLIQEIMTIAKMRARTKGIIVTSNLPTDIGVFCDRNMLKSIITNLLTNAIKFTPRGGAISISAENNDQMVEISVEDTGVGISAENIIKIKNATHFTTRGTENEKGTGLGVAMCKDFVERNKGQLNINSEEGKGSTFCITLPSVKITNQYIENRTYKKLS